MSPTTFGGACDYSPDRSIFGKDGPGPHRSPATLLWVYGFSTMLVACLHLKPLATPAVVSFPVHTMDGTRRRLATATAPPRNRFPYPVHPRPTPYQIFHLPSGASQKQVKIRCEFFEQRLRLLSRDLCSQALFFGRLRTRSGAPPGFSSQQGLGPPKTDTRRKVQRDKGRL